MLKFFQRLTKSLSIKSIVILGVVIMGIVITSFAFTMFYLSSTIKYDQNTLKEILALENHNQKIVNEIKNIEYINNKILLSLNSDNLLKLEDKLINDEYEFSITNNFKNKDYLNRLNTIIKNLNERIFFQAKIYDSKLVSLNFNESLNEDSKEINKLINLITIKSNNINGISSLLLARAQKNNESKKDFNFSALMEITNELNSSILKLPSFIYSVYVAKNKDTINDVNRNKLLQIVNLTDRNIQKLIHLDNLPKQINDKVKQMNIDFIKIKELINNSVLLKAQLLLENKKMSDSLLNDENLNKIIFKDLKELNEISNKIKIDILNHSQTISKQTTITIVTVGVLSLLLISLAASILIFRINLPLEFIIKFIDKIINNKRSLSLQLPIFSNDEFGKLSKSFNKLTSTIANNINEIKNLNKEIIDTQKEVIFTMGAIGETRSKETGNHVKRVALYSKVLALKYGLSLKEANLLKEASPMHDIGKVGIPDSVLKKEDRLDNAEWEIMKTHARLGYDMLKHSSREILKAAAIVAHEHHERWDGAGYPRALEKEHIHIYGRITAVADVFDALGSDRCYKKAWPLDKIKEYFIENRAKHFDPKLVDLFLDNLDEFVYIRDKYEDKF